MKELLATFLLTITKGMDVDVGQILKEITLLVASGLALWKFCLRQNALEKNDFVNCIFQSFIEKHHKKHELVDHTSYLQKGRVILRNNLNNKNVF